MKWSYGVTTVPKRVEDGLLRKTLDSLSRAGFGNPVLFIDGPLISCPDWLKKYNRVERPRNLRTFGNWVLSAWELYILEPHADRFAVFQDDLVAVRNLREYLERCDYPDKGYLNLYTFPQNEKEIKGWYLSNQLGKGALGTIMSGEALRLILSAEHMVNRPLHPKRGWQNVDGGIVTAMKKAGWQEYVHNPSLVQHMGDVSSMGHGKFEKASTFPGESFDALGLLDDQPTGRVEITPLSKELRIGLVGYNCASGIGELNRQLVTYLPVKSWLIIPHRQHKMAAMPAGVEVIVHKEERHVDLFLKSVDVVLFVETPFYQSIVTKAKALGKRVVCVPMQEWLPRDCKGWPEKVDLFICPTSQCFNKFREQLPCAMFPWPFDTSRFSFRQRMTCERFLFINGHGGWGGRKGEHVIAEAKRLWPELPIVVRSQKSIAIPNVEVLPAVESNTELYDQGDVLLMPHSIDGIGLELLEACAAGIPVVATDGEPWNEFPCIARIDSEIEKRIIRGPVDWYKPSAKSLTEICQHLYHQDIAAESLKVRRYAEERRWQGRIDEMVGLVRTGAHRIALPFTPQETVTP